MQEYTHCFSCNAKCLNLEGETHAYMLSSPGCWAMFNEVMEKEYSDFRYSIAHHFTVDAYACQHPGEQDEPRAVRSLGIHLASLYMLLEKGLPMQEAGRFKNELSKANKEHHFIHWLSPPENLGDITIQDVWGLDDAGKHYKVCKNWSKSVWKAWSAHHETVKGWVERYV